MGKLFYFWLLWVVVVYLSNQLLYIMKNKRLTCISRFAPAIPLMAALILQGCYDGDSKQKSNDTDPLVSAQVEVETAAVNEWPKLIDSVLRSPNRSSIETENTVYKGLAFKQSKTFTFDRYDDTYHYQTAERGDKFIISDVNVTSKVKDPELVPFGIYEIMPDSTLSLIKMMDYRLRRWEDYATYLGNYNDNTNDFSYSETVRFSIGGSVPDSIPNNKLIIVSSTLPSYSRRSNRFDTPPVSYSTSKTMSKRISKDFEWIDNHYIKVVTLK